MNKKEMKEEEEKREKKTTRGSSLGKLSFYAS